MKILFCFKNAEWLGVEYLSSVLKKVGYETELIFDSGVGDIEYKFGLIEKYFDIEKLLIEKARRFDPDLIAFSCLSNIYPWVEKMAAILKKELNKPIIVGGTHATMAPEHLINNENVDMVCRGEGEEALLELAQSMESGTIDYNIRNIWFKKEGSVIKNPMRPIQQNLDALPFPDKNLFYKYGCFKERLYVITARGCPFDCTYCFNHKQKELYNENNNYVRRRSVENVMEELSIFKNKYPIKEIFFYDDIFTLNKDWVEKFCASYKKNINLPFKCLVRPGTVKNDLLIKLKEAGCIYVDIGLESGDEEVRKNILNRKMSDTQIIETCKLLKKAGIKVTTLNMAGMPGEEAVQMLKTLELNQKINPDTALFSTFYPFPGTRLAEIAFKEGYLSSSDKLSILFEGGSYKETSILQHPEKSTIAWVVTFSPFLVKFPFMTFLMRKVPPNRFFRFIAIFFSSPIRNVKIRMFELIRMFIKTRQVLNEHR